MAISSCGILRRLSRCVFLLEVIRSRVSNVVSRPPQVTKDLLQYKNKISVYDGMVLSGRVEKTYLRGSLVYDRETAFVDLPPQGRLL